MPRNLVLFDLEWNIGYQPFIFNYHGVQQTFRGEIIEIGAVKIDEDANVLDTFSIHLRPRIFRCLQLERPFHDALSDTLYTADLCRMLDLRAGLAAYPSEEDTLRQSLCPTPGDYRDFRVFRGYLDQSMWKLDPVIGTMACPVCGTALQPDDVWLKKGSSGWYTLSQCPVCKGRGGEAGRGVFQKYRMSRRDGLHWAFARCVQMPDDASLVRWKKQKAQYLERQRLKAERQAAEAEAARHIF